MLQDAGLSVLDSLHEESLEVKTQLEGMSTSGCCASSASISGRRACQMQESESGEKLLLIPKENETVPAWLCDVAGEAGTEEERRSSVPIKVRPEEVKGFDHFSVEVSPPGK